MGFYGPAKELTDSEFTKLLDGVTTTSNHPAEDRVMLLLSYKAGLRVQEIAGLRWDKNILSPTGKFLTQKATEVVKGKVKDVEYNAIYVDRSIGKYSTDRYIPVHPLLQRAMECLFAESGNPKSGYVLKSRYKSDQHVKAKAHALKMRIARIYDRLGFKECSSHSGRRTFITNAARKANMVNCSLRDVQILAGHKHINTTEKYITASSGQYRLVGLT